ncbi:MAG: hypothetical protein KatS3mg014_1690 [Actinomycetota bacterium]|nr:MAG: hypothetical protein KatS3mg014_1690 [Actinomycetota bacterium]
MRRGAIALTLVVAGFALQAITYLFLATPIGKPTSVRFSNPRVPFAPALFILGVMLVFIAALVYELLPDRREDGSRHEGTG